MKIAQITGYQYKSKVSFARKDTNIIFFKATDLNGINFDNLSHSDKSKIEKAVADGTVSLIGEGQEYRVYSNNNLDIVIKMSRTYNPKTIARMRENLWKEAELVKAKGKYLEGTNTRIMRQRDSFIDSNGHLIVMYDKAKGKTFTQADLKDMDNLRAMAMVSRDLRRAGIRFPDDHKKNTLFYDIDDD